MSDSKKKRLSMLDSLSAAGTAAPATSMMSSNRALRSARDAVDSHRVWDLDPAHVIDERPVDRLDVSDVEDLRASIEANGQTVPILVRRHPTLPDRYLLVYGARRLAAIRESEQVDKVRALIANLDDDSALVAQVAENTARRDLSFIERALFALQLHENGFGTQSQIAEVLNATKSSVSMALSIARTIGSDLADAIGPAHGIGRPRWEALADDLAAEPDRPALVRIATLARQKALFSHSNSDEGAAIDPSAAAFEAVAQHLRKRARPAPAKPAQSNRKRLFLNDNPAGAVHRRPKGIKLELSDIDDRFAEFFEQQAQELVTELHARWKARAEGEEEQQ